MAKDQQYPGVSEKQLEVIRKHRHLLTQKQDGEAERLLSKLATSERLVKVNLPVFVMAVGISDQVSLLQRLIDAGVQLPEAGV